MKALLIDVDFQTGERAGGKIRVKGNASLRCHPQWQSIPHDGTRGREVRLIVDGNDAPYRDLPGVVVLEGEDIIDAVVASFHPVEAVEITDPAAVHAEMVRHGIAADEAGSEPLPDYLWGRGLRAGLRHGRPTLPKARDLVDRGVARTRDDLLATLPPGIAARLR